MRKRESPTDEDFERIAEAIKNRDRKYKIRDKQTFLDEWNKYFENDDTGFAQDRLFQEEGFKAFSRKYEKEYQDQLLYEIAHGLPRRRVGLLRRELVEMREEKPQKEFNIIARIRGHGKAYRVVYAHKETVKVKGKEQPRLRDRKGRFAGVKK